MWSGSHDMRDSYYIIQIRVIHIIDSIFVRMRAAQIPNLLSSNMCRLGWVSWSGILRFGQRLVSELFREVCKRFDKSKVGYCQRHEFEERERERIFICHRANQ